MKSIDPVGSLLLQCEFPDPEGHCLSCAGYSIDGEKTWMRRPDREKSRVDLLLAFTAARAVAVRLRQLIRGSGYTQWAVFPMTVVRAAVLVDGSSNSAESPSPDLWALRQAHLPVAQSLGTPPNPSARR